MNELDAGTMQEHGTAQPESTGFNALASVRCIARGVFVTLIVMAGKDDDFEHPTLKGFCVPTGYTLRTNRGDEVRVKDIGDHSGGHNLFHTAVSGRML